MSDTPGESTGRQSWKGSGGGGGEWRRPEGVQSWRRPEHGGPDDDRPSGFARIRRQVFKSLAAVMVTAACIVAAVWLIGLPGCVKTKLQPIVATIDDTPQLPPNLPVAADLEALNSLFQENDRLGKPQSSETSLGTPLVVYVSALWVPDAKGQVRVITSTSPRLDSLGDSKQLDSTSTDGFPTLAGFLSRKIGSPPRQNTLVLLDLCQMRTNWRIGVLENDIEQKIREAIVEVTATSKESDPANSNAESARASLAIICSCSRGQHSWASPHLGNGQTAFGFWVREALSGKADEDHDNLVTVSELFRFVSSETNHWVQQNRDRNGQHPVLITLEERDTTDFNVVQVGSSSASADSAKTSKQPDKPAVKNVPPTDTLNTLEELWTARNALGRDSHTLVPPAYHHDPLRWKELTFRLRRAEQWLFWNQSTKAKGELGKARKLLNLLKRKSGQESFADVPGTFVQQNIVARLPDRLSEDKPPFSSPDNTGAILRPENDLGEVLQNLDWRPGATDDRKILDAQAIEIRDRAERITSGAFGTYHRVQPRLASADRARRHAEDLLIVGDKATKSSFETARKQLEQARRIRSTLFAALLLRNRLHSELPDLARWTASRNTSKLIGYGRVIKELVDSIQRRDQLPSELRTQDVPADAQPGKVDLAGVKIHYRLMALFEQAHRLDKLLADSLVPDDTEDLSVEQLNPLQQLASDASTRLNSLHKALESEGERCLRESSDQPELWRDIQDILRHTGLAAVTRRKLLERSMELSQKLQAHSKANSKAGGGAKPKPPSKVSGMLHGLWAIKVLSLGRKRDDPAITRLWHTWRSVDEKSDAEWPITLRTLGAEIRQVSFSKRRDLITLVDVAGKQTAIDPTRRDLMQADRIARSLPPSDAIDVLGKRKNPTEALRRFQLSELLFAHAGRYLEDFWKGWFENAARECIAAGDSLRVSVFDQRAEKLKALLDQRIQLAKRIAADDFVKTSSPNPLRFGIPDKAELTVAFTPFADAPPGSAAVWLDLRSNEKGLLTLQGPPIHKRTISPTTAEGITTKFTLLRDASLKRAAGGPQSACPGLVLEALPRIFYRGHTANKQSLAISIDPCPPPIFRVNHVPLSKKTGQVSVEGKSKRQAIMFILDCSLSMSYGLANRDDPNKRWDTATRRLGEVIKGLYKPADQVKPDIGLIAFGHRVGKTGNTINLNMDYLKKKGQTLKPDVAKDPWKDIEILSSFRPLTDVHLAKTLKDIENLGPFGATPSLAAVQTALGEFQKRRSGGILVLITDGIYTDPGYNKKLTSIRGALQANPGVSLQVVLFGQTVDRLLNDPTVDPTIKVKERQQALDTLLDSGMGHEFHEAPEGGQLAEKLAAAIAPRPYFILDRNPGTKVPRTDRQLGDESPLLRPGRYSVGYESIRPIQFEIRGGEKHHFELQRGAILRYRPPEERRHLRLSEGRFATAENGLSLICSEYTLVSRKVADKMPPSSAVFTLCLVGKGEQDIVSRPREILLDIVPTSEFEKPLGRQRSRTTHWEVVSETTAPTWRVTVNDWPGMEAATIQAFWKSTPTPQDESRKRVWTEVEKDGALVDVPLPGFPGQASVRVKGKSDAGKKIQITITPSDESRQRAAGFHEHFGRLLPKLVWENGTNVADLEYSSEFTCEPGKEQLVYTFAWPSKLEFKPKELRVQIVSWTERKENAQQLTKPLVTRPFPPE